MYLSINLSIYLYLSDALYTLLRTNYYSSNKYWIAPSVLIGGYVTRAVYHTPGRTDTMDGT